MSSRQSTSDDGLSGSATAVRGRASPRGSSRIIVVQEGHFGDWKVIDRTVSELRVHAGPGYRVYFTRRGNTLVILLAGGDKQSQRRDIETARRLITELHDNKEIDP